MTEEDKLLELANAATPGPWCMSGVRSKTAEGHDTHAILMGEKQEVAALVLYNPRTHEGYADARFIAACSPETIRALVEGKRAAEARVAELEAAAEAVAPVADPVRAEDAGTVIHIRLSKSAELQMPGPPWSAFRALRAALTKNGVSA